jgi:hypothetical protein
VTSPAEWAPGERVELDKEKLPLVFYHFRPTAVEVVPPERLAEWERLMTEKVGIKPSVDEDERRGWVRTWSVCNGPGFCDCDQEFV